MNQPTIRRLAIPASLMALIFLAADWNRFRGPGGSGVSDGDGPLVWSETENVAWKTALPGFGASSPITVGDKIFVTSYRGYGLDEDEPGGMEDLEFNLVCLNRSDGEIVWANKVESRPPETDYRGQVNLHGYASATPASDGENVYTFFGRSGVVAFALDGTPLWRSYVGDEIHSKKWGSGASPIVFEDLVIVNASVESESVVALDKSSGREVWRVEGVLESWSTPAVVETSDGRKELVVSFQGKVIGLDPTNGELLWECDGLRDVFICPAVIAQDGVVFISGAEGSSRTIAIRAGGRGDVTETHRIWEERTTPPPGVPTPLLHDGHLYWISAKLGMAVCVDAETGETVYKQRLRIAGRGDKVYASLVLAGDKLYGVTRADGVIVLALGPAFEQLAVNRLDDETIFNATPVVSDGQLLIRSNHHLYCVGP